MTDVARYEEAQAVRQEVEATIHARLPEFSAELLAWDSEAILPVGVVRAAAGKLEGLAGHTHALRQVRLMVELEAYRQAIEGVASRLPPAQAKLMMSVGKDNGAGVRVECGRVELRAAKALADAGLLREVPESLGEGQMHFDVVLTTLGIAVTQRLQARESES